MEAERMWLVNQEKGRIFFLFVLVIYFLNLKYPKSHSLLADSKLMYEKQYNWN